ncbi:MAG TPA: PilN domain-containing protein [Solirubrobacteraceae bacterium]|jgi:Tfp pilus assembly protein PilN
MKAVNLLPPDLRTADRRASTGPRESAGAIAILGVLALVLVAVVATVLAQNDIKANQRELRTVEADQVVAEREVSSLASYGRFQALAAKRLSTVRDLAAARFDWERTLRDLSRAIPSDVTLDTITGSVSPDANAGGGASNPLRASIAAPAIELTGCTAGQFEVARLMARLRAVQGVTRVSLASSQKEDPMAEATAGATAGATATGTAQKREGCGKGSQPDFQLVIFFENAPAAPAGAAPTAATPATPAATPVPGQAAAAATPAAGQPAAAPTPSPAATPAAGEQAAATTSSTTKEVSAR